ncbi:MAG: hypothetical protein P8H56_02385 [Crocinitomicaceae bacterium]|nr:hypothetical protein [Crocinitomicaceae bacterium]MDG1657411.1 hypothetical protein [Crocinitomicaceae bacterium]
MNMLIKNLGLAAGLLILTTNAFGQKKNVTSAAVENQRAQRAMATGDIESAKKAYLSALGYIDLAAAHEDTKNDQKALWLKGEIYSTLAALGESTKDKEVLDAINGAEAGMMEAIAALKKGYPNGKKYKEEIEVTVDRNRAVMSGMASALYTNKEYAEAAKFYSAQAAFQSCLEKMDTNALFNAALSFDLSGQQEPAAAMYETLGAIGYKGTKCIVYASAAYRKLGQVDKAKAIVAKARETNPTDKDLLLEVVNTSIEEGDAAGAEKALAGAIAQDPENKQLHYTIGTIMIDLGTQAYKAAKEEGVSAEEAAASKATGDSYFEKAEASLQKALDIDPDYVDAQYQLGAHLVEWAGAINTEASKVDPDDRLTYELKKAKSKQTYSKALAPLEKYIASYPNDKAVLTILFQIHRSLGHSAKALDYKKRADAAE